MRLVTYPCHNFHLSNVYQMLDNDPVIRKHKKIQLTGGFCEAVRFALQLQCGVLSCIASKHFSFPILGIYSLNFLREQTIRCCQGRDYSISFPLVSPMHSKIRKRNVTHAKSNCNFCHLRLDSRSLRE